MITKSKQNWTVGQTVRVGFMSLVVRAAIATPGDGMPDVYLLSNKAGDKLYSFVPHNGLTSLSLLEAREMLADAQVRADRVAAQAIAKSRHDSKCIAEINDLIFAHTAKFEGHDAEGLAVYSNVVLS